jgi:hypothetical protein
LAGDAATELPKLLLQTANVLLNADERFRNALRFRGSSHERSSNVSNDLPIVSMRENAADWQTHLQLLRRS